MGDLRFVVFVFILRVVGNGGCFILSILSRGGCLRLNNVGICGFWMVDRGKDGS